MKKKFTLTAFLLALVICLSCVSAVAFAQTDESYNGGYDKEISLGER